MTRRRIEYALLAMFFIGLLWFATTAAVIRQVRLEGGDTAVRAAANTLLRDLRGNNLLTLDMVAWRKNLLLLPAVSDVRLRRRLPNTLEVTLMTRHPLAVWNNGGLVDDNGRRYAGQAQQWLPIFTGPAERAASMTEFYHHAVAALSPLGESIAQLQVGDDGAWQVFLDGGRVLYLGRDARQERLQRYVDNIVKVRQRFANIQVIDLRYERGFSIIVGDETPEVKT
ncbi:cell division protein FtsQ/DivIB [Candidatus Persebacteraceae bacterium Df01]|jgi:cell division protein FtsQ|uniref:Cell division protein FtsQ n=1 Tax=Candidatus Doriopsillibacter californiensis TaxID=2970740 RepID=A0ABT7QKM3_9GAMM|nr:cell division protein FtsQ/DivIB [Candidatus Persebacteraceae bacterium Df01]